MSAVALPAQVQTCKRRTSGSDILNLAMTLPLWLGDIHPCGENCPTALLDLSHHPYTPQLHFKSCRILVFLVAPSSATATCRCFPHHHTLLFSTGTHTCEAQSTRSLPFLLCYSIFPPGAWFAVQLPGLPCSCLSTFARSQPAGTALWGHR